MSENLDLDVARVASIDAVPTILEVICRSTGMGFAAVARVTQDRWVACAVRDEINFGLKPGGELKVETTICDEIRDSGQGVVIDHVSEDPAFCGHPTPAMYGFQSYISIPIFRKDQSFFGTLCAIDPQPAKVSRPEVQQMFRLFADLIALHLEAYERVSESEEALTNERIASVLREQFIAVLGHDLRNPLASIDAGVRMLSRDLAAPRAPAILALVAQSVARMTELINNVQDFARGRLGGGIAVARGAGVDLTAALNQVLDELRATWPDRKIEASFAMHRPVDADPARVAQLLSNLVANALTHGEKNSPVTIEGTTQDGAFVLSVSNRGDPIDPLVAGKLFQPFFRAAAGASRSGLGLGLYIASAIARAHGGVLEVKSDAMETRFTFTMPLA